MQINLKENNSNDKFCEILGKEYIIDRNVFDFKNVGDCKIVENVLIKGDVFVTEDFVKTDLTVFTKFEFICSRCLKNFVYDLNLKCNDEIPTDELEREEIVLDLDQNMDFTNYIRSYIISNIPQKKVCGSSCLGLCQCCGKNLNIEKCDCQVESFGNAFSKLKEVFVDSKEV